MDMINQVATRFGNILDVGPRQKEWIIDAGFLDVQEKVFKVSLLVFEFGPDTHFVLVPVGRWAEDKNIKGTRHVCPDFKCELLGATQHGTLYSGPRYEFLRDAGYADRTSEGHPKPEYSFVYRDMICLWQETTAR